MFIPAVLPLQEERFGSIDMISPWFDFDYTDYYYKEMGSSLFRRVMVFKDLIGQESLVTLKPNLAIESPITLDHVLAGRDMILDEEKETDFDLVWQVVSTVVTQSLAALTAMRANEAENLAGDLEERMTLIEGELKTIEEHRVAIKGPLATPVGRGMRSLNVRIRQELDLYACIRPVRYFSPVQSPVKHPEKVDITVFRENTEDLYAGIEWSSESEEVEKLTAFMKKELDTELCSTSSIGIKPICPEKTRRLVRRAVAYAVEHGLKSVTLMHKGNTMKFTEGGFRKWGYQAAQDYFGDVVLTEKDLWETYDGVIPEGKVLIKDKIADMVFAEVLFRPEDFDVIAAPNLNGDYISDALAAQMGGLGIAPGANIGDRCAVFEATHGTAPDLAGKDAANPCSIILSGAMMLDHLGWTKAADLVRQGLATALFPYKCLVCGRYIRYHPPPATRHPPLPPLNSSCPFSSAALPDIMNKFEKTASFI